MATNPAKTGLLVATLVALGVVFAPSTTASSGASESGKGTSVQVKGGEFFFRISTNSLKKPGKVTFVFRNIGHVRHDFKMCRAPRRASVNACGGAVTPLIQPGKTVKLIVTFKKRGKYPFLCTVPGHAQAGMKGIFRVR